MTTRTFLTVINASPFLFAIRLIMAFKAEMHVRRKEDELAQDLIRLARLSTHFLTDLGFSKMGRLGESNQAVWRNDDLYLIIGKDRTIVSRFHKSDHRYASSLILKDE